jgi:hypothetical protein
MPYLYIVWVFGFKGECTVLLKGGDSMALSFEEEVQRTKEAMADVQQYLSHEQCTTRLQLIVVLLNRIDVIKSDIETDKMPSLIQKTPSMLDALKF